MCLKKGGFTIIELLVSMAVFIVLSGIVLASIVNFRERQSLSNSPTTVVNILEKARALTISSREEMVYGVRVENSAVTFFKGAVFASTSPDNRRVELDNLVAASSTINGGIDIIFNRITGETPNSAVIDIYLRSNPADFRRVNVYQTGAIELTEP